MKAYFSLLLSLSECKADCDTCFNKNFCTKCKSGFYLHLGKCLDNCPEGLEANNHTMECVSIGEEELCDIETPQTIMSVSKEVLLTVLFHENMRDCHQEVLSILPCYWRSRSFTQHASWYNVMPYGCSIISQGLLIIFQLF